MTNSNSGGAGGSARPQRSYNTRSSTVSVTQLLSDSCSSLINRIANRVRGPSVHAIDGRSRRSKGPTSALAAAGVVRSCDKSSANVGAPAVDEFQTGRTTAAHPKREYRYGDSSRHQTDRLERKHWAQQQQPHHHRDKDDALKRSSSNVLVDTKRWLSIPSGEYVGSARERLHREPTSRSGAGRSHAARREYGVGAKDASDCVATSAPSTTAPKLSIYDSDAAAGARNSRVGGSHSFRLATARRTSRPDDRYDDLLGRCTYAYKERPLAKSATSIVLSEKAYPFVATAAACQRRAAKLRERTPYREEKAQQQPLPERQLRSYDYRHKSAGGAGGRRETLLYSFRPLKGCADCGSGRDSTLSVSRTRLDSSSTHDLTRSRRDSPHVSRTRGSTTARRDLSAPRRDALSSSRGTYLSRLTIGRDYDDDGSSTVIVPAAEPATTGRKAVEVTAVPQECGAPAPVTRAKKTPARFVDDGGGVEGPSNMVAAAAQSTATLKLPAPGGAENGAGRVSSSTSDREVKRKEIQALIEKYAGLVEQSANEVPNVLVKYQKKYSALLASSSTSESQELAAAKAVSVLTLHSSSLQQVLDVCVAVTPLPSSVAYLCSALL
ncbi:hypothetical protein V9T40_003477 [Parthenolecanium corni]|uniref:Uncharacterized protein n=1 Tax=Parthenolecanium corni TaxID=536013 RepID=A0AAN9TST4_9HEMI